MCCYVVEACRDCILYYENNNVVVIERSALARSETVVINVEWSALARNEAAIGRIDVIYRHYPNIGELNVVDIFVKIDKLLIVTSPR